MVSEKHVGGTRGSGIVSSVADVLGKRSWWSVRNVYGSGRRRRRVGE